MNFELTKIDPNNCSIDELKLEIQRLENLKDEYDGLQHSIKIFINSCYGACASIYFVGYNVFVAEAVTLQGQDLIFYANGILDDYFLNKWHLDTKLHKALGLTHVNKILAKTIVIYNDTDSLAGDTLIKTNSGTKTIENFYTENILNTGDTTLMGHESVNTKDLVLNWAEDKNLYYAPVRRIIRHKVSKAKWKLKTKSGKEVIVTNDHSMIVFRDGKKIEVKPSEMKKRDKILCVKKMEYYFDDIKTIEQIGQFEDEYVYDIEMDDDTHTFIGNDILVHNSTYMTFQPVLDSCDWKEDPKDFILKMKELRLENYLKQKFEEYSKRFNTENLQYFELEKIAYSGLMMAKKKYVLDVAWADPGINYKPQEKLAFTGVEIVQSSTSKFARKVLKELVKYIFEHGKKLDYSDAVKKLKEYKREFVMQEPDDICKGVSIGDYEKYVLDDRKEIVLENKCPINVRSASVYNNILFNSKWKSKYNLIRTGDKIKFYYAKSDKDVFGFIPGNYPYEFAPEIDYDRQFEKSIIEPFNRFIETLGFNQIPGNLIFARSLF
jgi:DNA polymerase elongation subunit (family B)